MAHWEFMLVPHIEVEHGFSASEMKIRQTELLNFLNNPANKEFTDEFLKQEGMKDFFGQKDGTGPILGSHYFYNMCYNSADNLWLLCGDCNRKKTNAKPLDWYKEQAYFGEKFVNDVTVVGGINRGIILDIVGGNQVAQLELNGTSPVNIYGGGKGLGKYTRQWFWENHKEAFEAHKQFYNSNFELFNKLLNEAQDYKQSNNAQYIRTIKSLKEAMEVGNAVLSIIDKKPNYDSDSSGTHSQGQKRVTQVKEIYEKSKDDSHHLNKLKSLLQMVYTEHSIELESFFSLLHNKSIGIADIKKSRYEIANEILGKPKLFLINNFDPNADHPHLLKENNSFVLTKDGTLFNYKDNSWVVVIRCVLTEGSPETLKKFNKITFSDICIEASKQLTIELISRLLKDSLHDVADRKPNFDKIDPIVRERFKQITQKYSEEAIARQQAEELAAIKTAKAEQYQKEVEEGRTEIQELKRKLEQLEKSKTPVESNEKVQKPESPKFR